MSALREARQRLGWSMPRLAREMGCTERAVAKWELNGTMRAEFARMAKAAEVLGVSLDELARDMGPARRDGAGD